MNKSNLTTKQELFCQLVANRRLPLYLAYKIAYKNKSSLATLRVNSSRLRKQPKIDHRINQLIKQVVKKHHISADALIENMYFMLGQSNADIIENGINKTNSNALFKAYDRLNAFYSIDPLKHAQINKIEADTQLKQLQYKQSDTDNDQQMNQVSKLLDKIEASVKEPKDKDKKHVK